MKNDIQSELISLINKSLVECGWFSQAAGDYYLDLPTDSRFGDLSTSAALQLSKALQKPPREIADRLCQQIQKFLAESSINTHVKQVKVEGAGFINFYLEAGYFWQQVLQAVKQGAGFFASDAGQGKKVLIEFVSANPTGGLSVAHARQAAVGDALARVLGFLGFEVTREYYLNDEGNQIDILGSSTALRMKELAGQQVGFPPDYYQGEYIFDIARKAALEKISAEGLADFAAEYILGIIKKELIDFGVEFDNWVSQRALRSSGKIEKALGLLKGKGFLYDADGALWFKSTGFGDDKDRVVVKSDGTYTYLAPDIAYHQEKYGRGFAWLINLWGPDHHGYIRRLQACVQALGHTPESLSIVIVQLASIYRDGKLIEMSTRKGQYITLREVLEEVGKDAARFFFLMRRTSSHLDFDLEVAKKQTAENPVYYVQYAHARICSILRNAQAQGNGLGLACADVSLLKEQEEVFLAKKILQFSSVLNICYKTVDPYMLTVYLQELSEAFHKFYDAHRVLGEDADLTQARLVLIEATRIVIHQGLQLLGISTPEKM